jgi:TRAP-type mannitol/chloroaromatic compound transport system permease small subunit
MSMLWTAVAAISRVAVWMGGAMLFAAAAIVTAEVLLRKGVGAILGTGFVFSGSDEISSFLFAVGTSWSMAYVLVTRGHVRIDALYIHFGPRTRALLDLFALLMLGVFAAALLDRSWDVAYTSYAEGIRTNSPQRLPLAGHSPMVCHIAVLSALALHSCVPRGIARRLRGRGSGGRRDQPG